ncbi:TIGR03084 family metal-binding protein [Streptomyces sp. NPDC006551]|uniref:TIGR03084 family metal-binding protein n=1 Tax=Streptomyces sp. NPDC006551 TaxID=3157178 RepID=UPI0033AA4404
MSDPVVVLDDLRSESEEVDRLVRELSDERWAAPTPAEGWTVAHQIAHLAWTDRAALLAVTDPGAFAAEAEKALAAPDRFVDEGAAEGAALAPAVLLDRWRDGRERLERALREAPPGSRFPWYGPPMSAASMGTARLMETWAHGQDIADTLGVVREPTARLRHVAWIGVRARDYAYLVRGIEAPPEPFRVELTAPDGEEWVYGPPDAAQKITGPALDFCLLVTQRVHRDDTALTAVGEDAERWLGIAQAFAGPAGTGRARAETGRESGQTGRARAETDRESAGTGRPPRGA